MAEKYNLCLDIGGTKVLGAIFDAERNIVYRLKKKTKAGGDSTENVEQVIVSVVHEMLEASGIAKEDVHAIAAAAPGVIDQAHGIILTSANLPWENYDIKSAVENDEDEHLLEHYGDILWFNNEKEQAVEQWTKALDKDPDNETLKRKVKDKTYYEE